MPCAQQHFAHKEQMFLARGAACTYHTLAMKHYHCGSIPYMLRRSDGSSGTNTTAITKSSASTEFRNVNFHIDTSISLTAVSTTATVGVWQQRFE